jgi:hypothetical protein
MSSGTLDICRWTLMCTVTRVHGADILRVADLRASMSEDNLNCASNAAP